jgi:threonyl-tRNA synthetase
MIEIQLPDGTVVSHPDDATPLSVANAIGSRLAKAVIAAQIGTVVIDANRPLKSFSNGSPIPLRLLTERDPESLDVLRHSSAHIMARAVMRLFPDVSLAFGPTISNGFYYDFHMPHKLTEDDFGKIEQEMASIIAKSEPFEQFSLDRTQAVLLCQDMKQELKVEHIQSGLANHSELGFYRQGEFVDLCRGPHIPDAGRVKAFKIMSTGRGTCPAHSFSDSMALRGLIKRTCSLIWTSLKRPRSGTTGSLVRSWVFTKSPQMLAKACVCGCPREHE